MKKLLAISACALLCACSDELERRDIGALKVSVSGGRIVFRGEAFSRGAGEIKIDRSDASTARVHVFASPAFSENSREISFCVAKTPELRFVVLGRKKHLIWIVN